MRCNEVSRRLDAYRTGEMARETKAAMTGHLAACTVCAEELCSIEAIAAELAQLRTRAPDAVLERLRAEKADRYAAVETDLGPIWVAYNDRGITMIDLGGGDPATFESACRKRLGRLPLRAELPLPYENAVKRAAAGAAPGTVRVDLSRLSSFEQTVLSLLQKIPRGEVRPYGWLAREAGNPRAVRAVGNTMAHNPVPLLLPCHRVVPTAGGIGKYAFGTLLKRKLLAQEGAPVEELEHYASEGVRFIGCRTTGIYCLPSCRDARRVQPRNRILLASTSAASAAGFRPCRHCRP